MALWCRACPVVTVTDAPTPKPITLVMPYYDCPRFFAQQIAHWWTYPDTIRGHLSAVIVDDGSPEPAHVLRQQTVPFPIRLFRIEQDVRWNWLAARNIGAHHAPVGWLLVTDMDHQVPAVTMRAVIQGQHDPQIVYAFSRREHTGDVITPHSASFLMTRELFWRIGGYDETLSGFYGTDGEYRRRVAKVAPIHVLTDALVRYEYVADSSTQRYKRKQPEDAAVGKLIAKRGKGWRPKTLSFAYHEVSA